MAKALGDSVVVEQPKVERKKRQITIGFPDRTRKPSAAGIKFRSIIELDGANPFVRVSPARAAKLKRGWRKPMPVLVRINGLPAKPWRINLMPKIGGGFFLFLHGQVRKASGTSVGDRVSVEVSFNEVYRPGPGPMPAYLRTVLRANPAALRAYRALPASRQKEILKLFSRLKSGIAKARNLETALRVLSGHPGRFMSRDWVDGR